MKNRKFWLVKPKAFYFSSKNQLPAPKIAINTFNSSYSTSYSSLNSTARKQFSKPFFSFNFFWNGLLWICNFNIYTSICCTVTTQITLPLCTIKSNRNDILWCFSVHHIRTSTQFFVPFYDSNWFFLFDFFFRFSEGVRVGGLSLREKVQKDTKFLKDAWKSSKNLECSQTI